MFPPDNADAADGMMSITGTIGDMGGGPANVSVSVEGAGPTVNFGSVTPEQKKRLVWLLVAALVAVVLFKKR